MRTRPIPASKQSRYLRDTSRAVEALVLSAWYATTGTGLAQPISQLQVQLPTLQEGASSQQPAMAAPVLAEVLDAVRSNPRPEELRAAMSEGIRQAVWKVDGLRGLSSLLGLEEVPARLETWDISHLYGTHTVGACSSLHFGMTAPPPPTNRPSPPRRATAAERRRRSLAIGAR